MNEGSPLSDVAHRLEDIRDNSTDLLVVEPRMTMYAKAMKVNEDEKTEHELILGLPGHFDTPKETIPSDLAHRQIATHLDIPQRYYDRCRTDAPQMLSGQVNHWMAQNQDSVRMLRLHRGFCRAFLSDRYRPLDNWDLAQAVLPQLSKGFEIRSCELTERHFYIKAISHEVEPKEVGVGDLVRIGICIRNSDVGCAATSVAPFVERLICTNGMTINEMASRKRHIGRRNNGFAEDEMVTEFLTDETRQAEDKAFWLKIRDTVAATAKETTLEKVVNQMKEAQGIPVEGDPVEVVRRVCQRVTVTNDEETNVMKHLIEGGDLSAYGVANAITLQAGETADYDRSSELEKIGWQVLQLPAANFSLN